ncbi:CatB-related O-acetyltransferase [Gymnodinialimonas ceratoperidinii]|uniref:CatB-related O-acetyltransferase n=1 Tax=Gymnodinialimonas ceratoperidinii TaxID=2856823 RepID=A0A8F6TXP4_9RHOB|nr:CatB-related O-acetyltransferase [Gymnodinialimonas ceratoperidinii]QXT39616.1 CatB-related O-acetyltransferase [Gymnodinialimonas ceratoperidinii]
MTDQPDRTGPDPTTLAPMAPTYAGTVFLKPLAEGRDNVTVGDYTYYDDQDESRDFFTRNVLHHYDFIGDHLHIGPFCAIAHDVRIFMNGGTHAMDGFSTFPFNIFGNGWEEGFDPASWTAGHKGDTRIGADVWIGNSATIMPGVTIGAGAIIAAKSVVTRDVPPYTIAAGNPAQAVKQRFDADTIARLLAIAWWDWPADKITRNLNAIRGADLPALEAAI